MQEVFAILLGSVLVNNLVLVKFLGLCPFMGVSRKLETALSMGLATGFVLTLAAGLSHLLDAWILTPQDLTYLRMPVFIAVIAAVVQGTEMMLRHTHPLLHQALGIFLPLVTSNCAVLGVALLTVQSGYGFVESLFYGFGSAMGFTLALVLFASLRERVDAADVPQAFRGAPIALITAGLMSMAFMGFAGLVR
jgi:electron transport complex protein RnfA